MIYFLGQRQDMKKFSPTEKRADLLFEGNQGVPPF